MKRSVRLKFSVALVSAPVVGGVLYAICGMIGLPKNEWATIAVVGGVGTGVFMFLLLGGE